MKLLGLLTPLLFASFAFSAESFAGTNLFYAAGLNSAQRQIYLEYVPLIHSNLPPASALTKPNHIIVSYRVRG